MDISVVIVSYRVPDLLARCLGSVYADARSYAGGVEAIVVDNAPGDGSAEMVRQRFPEARLIASPQNRGFAAGCNVGTAAAAGDSMLLLNPDAELMPGALGALADYLERHLEAGGAGPRTLDAAGAVQPSRRRFPTLATAFLESTIIQSHLPGLPHFRWYYCLDVPETREQAPDWLTGACLLLRRRALEEVGPLDERFFLYFEEADWFLRARGAGWRAGYAPSAAVVHHGGQSSAQDMAGRHLHFLRSKHRYYAKHFSPLAGRLVRAWLLADYALRIVEDGAKLAVGHKVRLRRERIRMLASVLRGGLAG